MIQNIDTYVILIIYKHFITNEPYSSDQITC